MVIFIVHPVTGTDPLSHPASAISIIAIIPSRYGSTRFPGKPLINIAGRPMIEHVYRRAAAAPSLDRILVATDDERIRETVETFGGEVRMTRATHKTGTDRLAEVAEHLTCDLIVNIQGDEPLIEPEMIEQALTPFVTDSSVNISTLRRHINNTKELHDPNVVKVATDHNGDALYFSRNPVGQHNGTTPSQTIYKHIGLYVYRRTTLLELTQLPPTPLEQSESLEQLRALGHGYRIRTVETTFDSVAVDTPEDVEEVLRVINDSGENPL